MVNDRGVSIAPAWDWLYQPRVHQPMSQLPPAADVRSAIAAADVFAGPVPASGDSIHCDVAEQCPDEFSVQMPDREKIGGSHASASSADVGLGPRSVDALGGPSIIRRAPTKGVIYYSDCRSDQRLLQAVRDHLARVTDLPIVSATLAPVALGHNIVLPLERGKLTMFKQILAALEASTADVIFHCEHDVLYHPSHFDFTPPTDDSFYYNQHTWKVDAETGRAVHYRCNQVSGLCAWRRLLVEHYRVRVAHVEAHGFERNLGYEPGTNRRSREIDHHGAEHWWSEWPNVDIRHGHNLTLSRWSPELFRNKNSCEGWTESDRVPGWGVTVGRFQEFLAGVTLARGAA